MRSGLRTSFNIICLFLCLGVSTVFAHGDGPSIEIPVGEYLLDIGYSPELIESDTQTRFDFLILNLEDRAEIDFDDVWVRIEKDDRLYYAAGLGQQRFGATGMTYRFTEAGEYTMYARFSLEGEAIADATFPFPVAEREVAQPFFDRPLQERLLLVAIGALVGALLAWFVIRSQKKHA